ncbi:MAG: chloramphenicol acetyltransferase [Bacteroidales bacterium]|nr:chloramphenicol acetyltransferase [Candidatus Egerieousia equi]
MYVDIKAEDSIRADACKWMNSPVPMVTVFKRYNVSRPVRYARRNGYSFTMLMCHCIGKAAQGIEEFYLLPVKGGIMRKYDSLAINIVVENRKGGLNLCDIPYSSNLEQFNNDYCRITRQCEQDCIDLLLPDRMIIGTSTVLGTELDGVVNQYSGIWNNPFISWSRYHKGWFRKTLMISMQFHHSQMDGKQVCNFLETLKGILDSLPGR